MLAKIAISGAHGTGKTTLCERIRKEFGADAELEICNEAPRLIIEAVEDPSFFQRGENTVTRQLLIFLYQMEEERSRGSDALVVLCDRTPVDHLAYTLFNHPNFESTPEYVALERLVRNWLSSYKLVYKLPIEFPPEDDGVREDAADFQSRIDELIDDLYERFEVRCEVLSGSIDDRSKPVEAMIANLLNG